MSSITMKTTNKILIWPIFRACTVLGKKKTFPERVLAFLKGLLFSSRFQVRQTGQSPRPAACRLPDVTRFLARHSGSPACTPFACSHPAQQPRTGATTVTGVWDVCAEEPTAFLCCLPLTRPLLVLLGLVIRLFDLQVVLLDHMRQPRTVPFFYQLYVVIFLLLFKTLRLF